MTSDPSLLEVQAIQEPLTRALQSQRIINDTDRTLTEARRLRDQAIIEARRSGVTRVRIAAALGVSETTVHSITRGNL